MESSRLPIINVYNCKYWITCKNINCRFNRYNLIVKSKEAEDFHRIGKYKNRSGKIIIRLINNKFSKKAFANMKHLEKISLRKQQLLRNFMNENLTIKHEHFAPIIDG